MLSAFDFTKQRNWISHFFTFDIVQFEKLLREKGEAFWQHYGEKRALTLFHLAATRVPAYKDFLKRQHVTISKVKTIKDFQHVPITDKRNYIQQYALQERCWDGNEASQYLVAVSSGTTGEPQFWPRGSFQEFEAAVVHELLYRFHFKIETYSTLLVIGFPMGVYVSGVATLIPSALVATKGYPMTIVSVGTNKTEILRVVQHLASKYEQVVLIGHPFFIKEVVETGKRSGIRWETKRLRMMFCSEGFSERWRRYVIAEAGIPFEWNSAMSTYGSSELLLMAYETPVSIFLRNILEQKKNLRQELFSQDLLPDLFQYNPLFRYIETVDNELLFTSVSGIPLVRFNLHDSGTIISFERGEAIVKSEGSKRHEKIPSVWRLPFLAFWGRSDYTLTFYAANIYPQHIRQALMKKAFLDKITGKFTLQKGYVKNMDEFLEIIIELKENLLPTPQLQADIQQEVVSTLQKVNIEYRHSCDNLEKDLTPRITLVSYQDERYFKPGVKPKYILST